MTVGGKVFDMVWDMIWGATYSSAAGPEVDNHVKHLEPDPGLVKAVNDAIENYVKQVTDNLEAKSKQKTGVSVYQLPPGKLEKSINKILNSTPIATKGLGFLRNPMGAVLTFLKGPIGGPLMVAALAIPITMMITKEMVRKGSIFDRTFKNVVDNRVEALRTRELQQRIRVGFGEGSQLITTTNAGTTSPRYAYNTYEQFNNNQREFEDSFSIRNNSGYE